MNFLHKETGDKVLRAFYNVYNKMGFGFAEKVYENSMMIELRKIGVQSEKQKKINVYYDSDLVGEYFADIVVDNAVILELKAASGIAQEHETQLYNYLRATDVEVGYILNFGEKPQFKRIIFTNDRKHGRDAA